MMQKNNGSKKRWVSTVLLTGVILAGMMPVGAVVNAVSRDESTVSMQESGQLANDQKSGFEKITADADAQKAKEDSSAMTDKDATVNEDKNVPVINNENSETKEKTDTVIEKKVTSNKSKSITPTLGYVGPSTNAVNTTWETVPVDPAKIPTTFVSPSGSQSKPDEPVLYFGNKVLSFQPSSFTNNRNYIDKGNVNVSSWMFVGKDVNGINLNPRRSYGIIVNGSVPDDRGYFTTNLSRTNTIESAVKNGKITNYQLYKNTNGTGFKATMYDTDYKLSYTFEEMYDELGGIYSYFSITNNDPVGTPARDIGAVQGVDTFVDNDSVPVINLGKNAGFKMVGDKHVLNYRLNSPVNNAKLGGWTNYSAGVASDVMWPGSVSKYFSGGISGNGMEQYEAGKNIGIVDISSPDVPVAKDADTGFTIKANPKKLAPGETLTNGSYLTYKPVTPSIPPVATVSKPIINAYKDDSSAMIDVTGNVIDEDSTKGHIEITYPDGSTSPATDNKYDTSKINTSISYTAKIDPSRLTIGENTIVIAAVDDKDNKQLAPVTMKINLITLGATPITQNIKVGGTVSTVEKDLISDIKILNPTGHTLKIDTSNPSKNPVNPSKVGHYVQDMLLTDTVVSPNKVAKIAIPVNVTDNDTATDNTSAVYAHKFETKTTDIAKLSDAELNALIILKSEAKGWILETGANSAVSVRLTTLKATSPAGTYKATIANAAGKEITIDITVTGGDLKITSAPDAMNYGATSGVMLPYSAENFNLQRQDNSKAKVSISNAGQQGWKLAASVSKPLTNGTNTLKGVLKYVDTKNVATDLDSGSVIVGSGVATQDVTWDAKQGIIANLNGNNTSLKAGKYTGEITWTLTDAPSP